MPIVIDSCCLAEHKDWSENRSAQLTIVIDEGSLVLVETRKQLKYPGQTFKTSANDL
jgi:hypothetical protein